MSIASLRDSSAMNKTVKISLITVGTLIVVVFLGISLLFCSVFSPRIACLKTAYSMEEEVRYVLYAPRGDIYDTNGNVLATSKDAYNVFLDCAIIQNDTVWKEKTLALAPQLAVLFPERGAAEWWDYLQDGRKNNSRYLKIAKRISPEQKDSLARLPIFNMKPLEGGAIYENYQARVYPYDSLARRTIGDIRSEGTWKVGIEGKWDGILHGTDGYSICRNNRFIGKGRKKEIKRKEAVPGGDIRTSLSMPIQLAADSILRATLNGEEELESGCLIMMEVRTGAIRAMVNLSKGERGYSNGKAWERYNCALASLYEPGEVLQTMTLASVLRDGYFHSLEKTIPTNHGILPDYMQDIRLLDYERTNRTDRISLKEGFAQSSKYVFGKLATDYYKESTRYYAEGLEAWCLPVDINLDVEGLRAVDITDPESIYWKNSTLPSVANGHDLVMTPLDILSFYNTIANRGKMMKPYLVETFQGVKDKCYQVFPVVLKAHAMAPAVADTLAKALRLVTTDGTGARLLDAKVPIAGKTGTALQILKPYDENGLSKDPYHDKEGRWKTAATYAGFFPADAPKYSVICVLYSYPCRKTFFGGTYPALVIKELVNELDFKQI